MARKRNFTRGSSTTLNRSNNRNSARVNNTLRTSGVVRKWEVNGLERHPLPDPKPCLLTPWNSVVLEYATTFPAADSYLSLNATSIYTRLIEQIGVAATSDQPIQFKIQDIASWNLDGGQVAMDVGDFIGRPSESANTVHHNNLVSVKDWPGRNMWSAVAYTLPRSYQIVTHQGPPAAGSNWVYSVFYGGADGQAILIRVRILWKFHENNPSFKFVTL